MGTFAAPTVKISAPVGNAKIAVVSCAGSSSYATGGDTLDLSSGSSGFNNKFDAFAEVFAVTQVAIGAAADDIYDCKFVPAAAGAPATGLVKIRDLSAASDAEVSNATNLSGKTFYFLVVGR